MIEKGRKKKLETIPGKEKILKYLVKRSAPSQKEPGGSEEGNTRKGVRNDPLLGDPSQGTSKKPSSRGNCPKSEESGGRGEPEVKKRSKILERWPFLSGNIEIQGRTRPEAQRGKGEGRKPGLMRK